MDRACSHRTAQEDSESPSQCATTSTTHCINVTIKQQTKSGPVRHIHNTTHQIQARTLTCVATSRIAPHLKYGVQTSNAHSLPDAGSVQHIAIPPTYTQRLIRQENQKTALPRLKEHCGCYYTRAC